LKETNHVAQAGNQASIDRKKGVYFQKPEVSIFKGINQAEKLVQLIADRVAQNLEIICKKI